MARPTKQRTVEQYAEDMERTAAARAVIRESGVTMGEICYHLQKSYITLSSWLRFGLDRRQYRDILQAVAAARAAQDRQEGR